MLERILPLLEPDPTTHNGRRQTQLLAHTMARLSGLQKEVLKLYKRSLKLVASKPVVRPAPVHPSLLARLCLSLTTFASYSL